MPLASGLAKQALVDGGFEEQHSDLGGEEVGPIFRNREIPRPWSIIASMNAGDAPPHVDISLQFRGQQVGTIHRVASHPALVSNLPAIVSSLTALVGSNALMCPRCGEGWLAVGQSNPPDAQGPFFFCTDCWQKLQRGAPDALQPVVIYRL